MRGNAGLAHSSHCLLPVDEEEKVEETEDDDETAEDEEDAALAGAPGKIARGGRYSPGNEAAQRVRGVLRESHTALAASIASSDLVRCFDACSRTIWRVQVCDCHDPAAHFRCHAFGCCSCADGWCCSYGCLSLYDAVQEAMSLAQIMCLLKQYDCVSSRSGAVPAVLQGARCVAACRQLCAALDSRLAVLGSSKPSSVDVVQRFALEAVAGNIDAATLRKQLITLAGNTTCPLHRVTS